MVPLLRTILASADVPAARFASGLCNLVSLRKQRAQGMPGGRTHPLPCVQNKKTHAGQHRDAEITPALPAQWLYGLFRALAGVSVLLAPVADRSSRPT